MMDGDAKGALAAFDRALAADPALEPARLNRAVALLRMNDPAGAIVELARVWANEASPFRAQAAYHHGIALDRMGRPAEAETWLARAVELDPKLDAALLYTGLLRERRGDLDGAARAYLDYLKVHPQSTAAMLRLGVAAQKAGRLEVAKLYLKRLLDADPSAAEAAEARKFLVMWE